MALIFQSINLILQHYCLRKNINVSLMLYNEALALKIQVKYLGGIFQENGLYSAHAKYVQENCHKCINVLRMLKGSNWKCRKTPPYLFTGR